MINPDDIVSAAMQDEEIENLKYPEQFLYNAIIKIKYNFRYGKFDRSAASSYKMYARHVAYESLKHDEKERDELYRMVLDICHAADKENMIDIKRILADHDFIIKKNQLDLEELT